MMDQELFANGPDCKREPQDALPPGASSRFESLEHWERQIWSAVGSRHLENTGLARSKRHLYCYGLNHITIRTKYKKFQ